jgi:DNA-binding transcriptional MocR family regulator
VEALAGILQRHRPRLYITNSAFHNPTGAQLSPVVAHRLLKLAEAHDLLIVEDDIFADFEHEQAPRLAAFDGLARVIQVGSFSKTLSASLRCGYIATRADWCEQLVDLKLATSFGNSPFNAELLHQLLLKGGYRRHLDSLRARLAEAMGETLTRLRRLGLQPWLEPRGGVFVWARLPGGLAATVPRGAGRGHGAGAGECFSGQTAPDFCASTSPSASRRSLRDSRAQHVCLSPRATAALA